jgi:hypothetical protein
MGFVSWLQAQWDRAGALVATLVGAAALFIGYIGISDTEYVAKQMPYMISGGIGGVVLIAVGAALWVSADLRDEWREVRYVRQLLQEQGAGAPAGAAPVETDARGWAGVNRPLPHEAALADALGQAIAQRSSGS